MSSTCPSDHAEVPSRSIRRDRSRVLSRPTAFVTAALVLVLFLAASAAPSPLYVVYQQQWDFSPSVLTLVFAIYVFGLLGSLLVVGALSDHIGRRPVLGAAIGLELVSMLLFLLAPDVEVLAVARLLQGIATGAAITTLAAMLVDLAPPHAPARAGLVSSVAPVTGLAFGALACGALVQFAPAPTHLVYVILLGLLVLAALATALAPETSTMRTGAWTSLRPRVAVAPRLRPEFVALVPVMVAQWAVAGLYLSLGPSVAVDLLGLRSHVIGGLVPAFLCGIGGLASLVLRNRSQQLLVRVADVLLAVGILVTLLGVGQSATAIAVVGTLIAGVGFGAGGLALFGTLARIAGPHERGELFAAGYTVSYLGFSVPAVIAGVATTHIGLRETVMGYGLVVAGLSVLALVLQQVMASRTSAPMVD